MIAFDPVDSDRFMAEDDGASVVMLNLLRLRPDRGRDRYLEHLSMAGPLAARQGAEIIYAGDGLAPLAAEPGQDWHAAAQVRHPSRRAFAALLADPDHHAPDPVRLSALAEAVLQPMRAMGARLGLGVRRGPLTRRWRTIQRAGSSPVTFRNPGWADEGACVVAGPIEAQVAELGREGAWETRAPVGTRTSQRRMDNGGPRRLDAPTRSTVAGGAVLVPARSSRGTL